MSRAEDGPRRPEDRVSVPGNGHRPPLAPTDASPSSAPVGPPSAPSFGPTAGARIVVTPTQLAAGFAIIASLILLAVGRRRIRRRDG